MREKSRGEKGDELAERLLDFAVTVVKVINALPKTLVGRHVGGQLLRSGTSPGSNYEEARGAESRADFVHKLGIVLKELKETRFWLRVAEESSLISAGRVALLTEECGELCAIIAKSIITAKKPK